MNLHASLIADLLLYNFDWLYNVLSSGIYEERFMDVKDVIRYRFNPEDIDTLYLWTSDTKNSIGKISNIKRLGYNVEIINAINLYDYIFEPERDRKILTLRRFVKNSQSHKMSISYGPIFKNHYTDIKWHKGQFNFIWEMIKDSTDKKLYLDFNLNKRYLDTKRLNGMELEESEKNEFVEYVRKVVGKDVEVFERPNYFSLDSRKDFDIGEENFCFGRSYLNIGINDMHLQKAKEMIHNRNSHSIILNERPGETVFNRDIKQGKYQDEMVREKEKEKESLEIVENTGSLFEFLAI